MERILFYSAISGLAPRRGRIVRKDIDGWTIDWLAWPEYLARFSSPSRNDRAYAAAKRGRISPPGHVSYHPSVRFEFLEPGVWPDEVLPESQAGTLWPEGE